MPVHECYQLRRYKLPKARTYTSARGVTGIGIYAKGTLEAVYTGGDLSISQIQSMTTGDASATAMANKLWSYRGSNTVPALLD